MIFIIVIISTRCQGVGGEDCYQCYSGVNCQEVPILEECQLQSLFGNPEVLSEYWTTSSLYNPCLSVPADYRYEYTLYTIYANCDNLKGHLSVCCAAYLPVPVCINFMPKMKHLSSPYFKIIMRWYVLLFALYGAWKAKVWKLNKISKQAVQEVEYLTNMQDVVGFNSAGSIFLCSCTFVHTFESNL